MHVGTPAGRCSQIAPTIANPTLRDSVPQEGEEIGVEFRSGVIHVIPRNEKHPGRLERDCVDYFLNHRIHHILNKNSTVWRAVDNFSRNSLDQPLFSSPLRGGAASKVRLQSVTFLHVSSWPLEIRP